MATSKAKEIVSANPVVVFSKTYCPFCVSVKKLLTELGASFKAIELDTESCLRANFRKSETKEIVHQKTIREMPLAVTPIGRLPKVFPSSTGSAKDLRLFELVYDSDGSEIQSALREWTGQGTVPNVFIAGKHIGGCDATTAMHKGGNLMPLLNEAGAVAKSSA
ncbi:unnamed protein product [Ilex paraguariensis]|uniref:Glutaredoxin domain-containing protein n=1 Tax=Ilex paraguariensis TaxID=185542 RepID=A0ABC8U3B9_9AQUA